MDTQTVSKELTPAEEERCPDCGFRCCYCEQLGRVKGGAGEPDLGTDENARAELDALKARIRELAGVWELRSPDYPVHALRCLLNSPSPEVAQEAYAAGREDALKEAEALIEELEYPDHPLNRYQRADWQEAAEAAFYRAIEDATDALAAFRGQIEQEARDVS